MIVNVRLYARVDKELAMFLLDQAESYEEAIETVRNETQIIRVFAVVDGITKV